MWMWWYPRGAQQRDWRGCVSLMCSLEGCLQSGDHQEDSSKARQHSCVLRGAMMGSAKHAQNGQGMHVGRARGHLQRPLSIWLEVSCFETLQPHCHPQIRRVMRNAFQIRSTCSKRRAQEGTHFDLSDDSPGAESKTLVSRPQKLRTNS